MRFNELKKLVRVKKICKGVYHFIFPTTHELARTMLRFQEHYESPKFKDKIFTLKEFKDWYGASTIKPSNKPGFTYYSDWVGFNFPDYIVKSIEENFSNLTEREKLILHYCHFIRDKKFYIVATSSDDNNSVLDHEMAHALYYVNNNYKNKVNALLKDAPKEIDLVHKFLHETGYSQDVFNDEIHAWLCHDVQKLKEVHKVNISPKLYELSDQLHKIYVDTISDLI